MKRRRDTIERDALDIQPRRRERDGIRKRSARCKLGAEDGDVRSPAEYTGEVLHMAGYPQEGAQRGGHVRGAQNIPWATAANEDHVSKTTLFLTALKRFAEREGIDVEV